MATYSDIPDSDFAPDKIGKSSTFIQLNQNIKAARDANRKLVKYTTAGTFTYQKPDGLKRAVFELVGAGGGGSDAGGALDSGGGGGAGAYVMMIIDAEDLDANTQLIIGVGGYYFPFADGGTTSITTTSLGTVEAGGGKTLSRNGNGGLGGVPNQTAIDNADVCKRGEGGAGGSVDISGRGGDSQFSLGANGLSAPEIVGEDGRLGSGGSGARYTSNSRAGGRGGDGAIYITEVY